MVEQLTPFEEQKRELDRCKTKLMELARLLRNTDHIESPGREVYVIQLLEDVQEMYPGEYRRDVAGR